MSPYKVQVNVECLLQTGWERILILSDEYFCEAE